MIRSEKFIQCHTFRKVKTIQNHANSFPPAYLNDDKYLQTKAHTFHMYNTYLCVRVGLELEVVCNKQPQCFVFRIALFTKWLKIITVPFEMFCFVFNLCWQWQRPFHIYQIFISPPESFNIYFFFFFFIGTRYHFL